MPDHQIEITLDGPPAVAEACGQLGLEPPGTAPLTAVALDVPMGPGDLAFHCDLVRIADGRLVETPADSGSHGEALLERLRPIADRLTLELVIARGPRGLLIYRGGWPFDLQTHDPATLLGQPIAGRTPRGAGDEVMRDLMESGAAVLGQGLWPWVWGGGSRPILRRIQPPGLLIGGDLPLAGLARLIGWEWRAG